MHEVWETFKASIGDRLLEFGARVVAVIFFLIVGIWLIRKLTKFVRSLPGMEKLSPTAQSFLNSALSILLKGLLAVLVIATLGVPTTSIIAALGSIGLAIGLALQGSLQNIAGGLIIMIFKPFLLGDYVTVGEYAGTVTEIGAFFTVLTTPDNRRVVVPNAQMSNKEMINAVSGQRRRVDLSISAPYEAKAEDVFAALAAAAAEVPDALADPAPFYALGSYGDSAIQYFVQVWCESQNVLKVRYALNESVKRTFDARGVAFPFPQLDVHIAGQSCKE